MRVHRELRQILSFVKNREEKGVRERESRWKSLTLGRWTFLLASERA